MSRHATAQLFEEIAGKLCAWPDVSRARLFGFDCLRARAKVFAKLDGSLLVLKLSPAQAAALLESGAARPYALRGRSTIRWVVVSARRRALALDLAIAARDLALAEG